MSRKKSVRCAVVHCTNRPGTCNEIMARFPLDVDRCREWVRRAGQEDLVHIPVTKLNSIRRICGAHFEDSQFSQPRRRLRRNAVPTVFSDDVHPLPEELMREFPPKDSALDVNESNSEPYSPIEIHDGDAYGNVPPPELQVHYVTVPTPTSQELSVVDRNGDAYGNVPPPELQVHYVTVPTPTSQELSVVDRKVQCAEESRASSPAECAVNDAIFTDLIDCEALLDSLDDAETLRKETLEDMKLHLCRICGLRSEELSSIFCEAGSEKDNISLEKKIKMYLPIELNNGLPLNICSKCCDLVESWHELYMSCLAADSILSETFGINMNLAAFEVQQDETVENSSQEEYVEESLGLDEQGMVDPTPESQEQSGSNKLSENSATTIGVPSSSSNQITKCPRPSVRGHCLYTCPHCSERFESIQECSLHRKQCALEPAICDICGKTVRNRCCLKIHRRQHNFVPVLCEKCGFELRTRGSVLHHKKKCLGRVKYFCEPCCKLFSLERTFKLHLKMHNQMKNLNLRTLSLESCSLNDEEEYFICPVCDEPFEDKFSVIKHMNTENKSSCFQCGKSLQNERETFLHKCRKWTCCYCCAEFADSKVLRQHKLIHKSDEPFICKKCGRKFTSRMQFLRHKNFHYAKGFFQCEKCGKEFTQKYPYQDHMRKHEGIKWKCNYCDWSSFCRRAIYKHIRKYHPGIKNTRL